MPEPPVREVQIYTTPEQARAEVLGSFGNLHFVDTGDRLVLVDGDRYMQVVIVLKTSPGGASESGSAGVIRFSFVGYSEAEADDLLGQYMEHRVC